ncbi:MAG: YqgE/AlgH family protein [Gammaproteobacteria bacterium]|nr:YqgE/AlgH family protein [Gammaproteobacteria bacterium]
MKSLANQFLLPLPDQDGSYFDGSLTYICTHSDMGASGLIVNRPTKIDLNKLFELVEIKQSMASAPQVYEGGPVEMNAPCVLHTDDVMVEGSIELGHGLGLTLPVEDTAFHSMLERISGNEGPRKFMVMLGYAGWHQGQLDKEINDNVWLTCPGSHELLFETPVGRRADEAARSIGIDLHLLSGDSSGYA